MTDENSQNNKTENSGSVGKVELSKEKPVCGIVRPISAMSSEYPEQHWKEIAIIIDESIKAAGFESKLVSDAAEVSVIQKNIVQNLYECPIIICDVSGKNANVMFELGLRLAFDKPMIIIKDDKTDYNFDTSVIEHLIYPKSLHYPKIKEFKKKLAEKLQATHKIAQEDKNYSPFLKHFGQLIPAKIEKQEVPEGQFIQEKLANLEGMLSSLVSAQIRKNEERSNVWAGLLSDDNRKAWRMNSESWQQKLFQKLDQAQEELRHTNSAAAAAEKRKEIERLEKLILSIDDEEEFL